MGTAPLGKVAEQIRQKMSARGLSYIPPEPPRIITPYFPPVAYAMAQSWESNPRQYTFAQAVEIHDGECPNCGNTGIVEMKLSKAGPFRDPPGSLAAVIFWFDGDGQRGKGWYIQHERRAYECPECQGPKGKKG